MTLPRPAVTIPGMNPLAHAEQTHHVRLRAVGPVFDRLLLESGHTAYDGAVYQDVQVPKAFGHPRLELFNGVGFADVHLHGVSLVPLASKFLGVILVALQRPGCSDQPRSRPPPALRRHCSRTEVPPPLRPVPTFRRWKTCPECPFRSPAKSKTLACLKGKLGANSPGLCRSVDQICDGDIGKR